MLRPGVQAQRSRKPIWPQFAPSPIDFNLPLTFGPRHLQSPSKIPAQPSQPDHLVGNPILRLSQFSLGSGPMKPMMGAVYSASWVKTQRLRQNAHAGQKDAFLLNVVRLGDRNAGCNNGRNDIADGAVDTHNLGRCCPATAAQPRSAPTFPGQKHRRFQPNECTFLPILDWQLPLRACCWATVLVTGTPVSSESRS